MHLQVVYLLTVMGTAACSCVANIRPKDLESHSVSVSSRDYARVLTSSPYPFYFYNYSLTAYQARTPDIAISISQLEGPQRSGLSFSVRSPANKSSNAIVTFLLGLDWTAYNWLAFTFRFLASSRDDIQVGQFLAGKSEAISDLSGLLEKDMEQVSFRVNVTVGGGEPKMVLLVSGIHIKVKSKPTSDEGYAISVETVGIQGDQCKINIKRSGNCDVDYIWLSYVKFGLTNPNMTIVYGSFQMSPPSDVYNINKNSQLFTLFGANLFGLSGLQVSISPNVNTNTIIDEDFNLITASTSGQLVISYIFFQNTAESFCGQCPSSPILDRSYCVDSCSDNFAVIPRGSIKYCRQCNLDDFRIPNKLQTICMCADNTFQNNNSVCQPCQVTCLTCIDSKTCLTCDSNPSYTKRLLVNSQCVCPSYYFDDDMSIICRPCHYSCLSCSGPSNKECLNCLDATNRVFAMGMCVCKNGFSDNGTNRTCFANQTQACPNGTLINGTCVCSQNFYNISGICISCPNNSFFNQTTSNCQCNDTFYFIKGNCTACPKQMIYNATTNSCLCRQGFQIVNEICRIKCLSNETYNFTSQKCECAEDFVKINNSCRRCSNNTYFNGSECKSCINGTIIEGQCKCRLDQYLNDTSCIKLPPNMTFVNGSFLCAEKFFNISGNCSKCYSNTTYNPQTQICECRKGFTNVSGKCVILDENKAVVKGAVQCKQGYTNVSGICQKCPENTAYQRHQQTSQTLDGSEQVTMILQTCICNKGFYNISGRCLSPPENQTYNSSVKNFVCLQGYLNVSGNCYLPCKVNEDIALDGSCTCQSKTYNISGVCTRAGPNQVFNGKDGFLCEEGYILFINICTKKPNCTDPNSQLQMRNLKCICKVGSNLINGSCSTCPDNSVYSNNSCICNKGFQMNNNLCQSICKGGQTFDGDQCVCPSGMIFVNNTCKACPQNSQPNSKLTDCQCKQNFNLINGKCQTCQSFSTFNGSSCICNQNYFLSGDKCLACWSNAFSNGSDCICKSNFFRINEQCVACDVTCETCSGPSNKECLSCADKTITLVNRTCLKNPCKTNEYLVESKCVSCIQNCDQCKNGVSTCTRCQQGFQLSDNLSVCNDICGDGRKFSVECDDNNTINGDGCSSTCKIQQNWKCTGGNSTQKDSCKPTQLPKVIITPTSMFHSYANTIISFQLNYIPQVFLASNCSPCYLLLSIIKLQGLMNFSLSYRYSPNPKYTITAYLFFGTEPITPFSIKVQLNPIVKRFFQGYDTSQVLYLAIDPEMLPGLPY